MKSIAKIRVLTAQEVSRYLRIPLSTIYALAAQGKLKGIKIGRHWRFREEEIRECLWQVPLNESANERVGETASRRNGEWRKRRNDESTKRRNSESNDRGEK